ncbi:hypothetical protein JCM9157_3877 [Halalkalibacter akibai JCM 9157]|uniref:Lipoprotein n=2 Tax=Halalkalibacter akibai TaxID=1411 RepID=W4QZC7_HALA3|nr:hypothetical protein JCM9157_3877 [Halalkalibacter akibai JCM 9157]
MKTFGVVTLASVLFITGCVQNTEPVHEHKKLAQPILEYTVGSDDWAVVTSVTDNPDILEAYQFAVSHPEVLDYMPCYCGCYEEDGHISNTHCFVEKVENGIVTLDTMGFG